MQQPIEPKNEYTTDELYLIYNSINFNKEHPNIVAYITLTNTEEQKLNSYNESLSKKLRFRMMGYKAETEYLDTTTKTEYIQEKLSVKFTPIKHVLGTPYERIENQSDRSADRLFKMFLDAELNKLIQSENSLPKIFAPKAQVRKSMHEPTLKELALYFYYLSTPVTKENQNKLLEKSKHKSGAKLKQNYDFFNKTINRINADSDRKNNHRIKEFENVIIMLGQAKKTAAKKRAEAEFATFKSKID